MSSFEAYFQSSIPLDEASEYFIRVLGREKRATANAVKEALRELPAEERQELLKAAEIFAVAEKSPEEVGKERAHAALSAEFEKEKHHSKEHALGGVGTAVGAAAGGAAMHAYAKRNPVAVLGGAALGGHYGRGLGKALGARADRRSFEKKGDGGIPMEPLLSPETQQYFAASQAAQQAQAAQEAPFYRQKLVEAKSQALLQDAQVQMLQTQKQMSEQQLAQAQQQLQEAVAQASTLQDQSVQQQQAAAALRMAYQQLRGNVLQAASQDPPSLPSDQAAGLAAAPTQGPAAAPSGPAGQAPSPQAGGGSAPVSGDDPNEAPVGTTQKMQNPVGQVGTKTAATFAGEVFRRIKPVLPGALAGAVTGGGVGAYSGHKASKADLTPLRQRIDALSAKHDRSYKETKQLASARASLTMAEFAKEHPKATVLGSALSGAATGVALGPRLTRSVSHSTGHVKEIAKNVREILKKD